MMGGEGATKVRNSAASAVYFPRARIERASACARREGAKRIE